AAWSRLKHPHLISGALASSAPLLAVMDFYGFMQVVDEHCKNIGGACYEQIENGIKEAQRLFQSAEGRANLAEIFKIDPPLSHYDDISDNDRQLFFNQVTVIFKESVQYNEPSPGRRRMSITEDAIISLPPHLPISSMFLPPQPLLLPLLPYYVPLVAIRLIESDCRESIASHSLVRSSCCS
ncbi:hypothetical protein PENTCL1PPCAC_19061, partial [Pristionchus entomophagus]